MTNYKRVGAKWTINECLRLQREYELLKLSIDEIAALHERSAQAIMYKLDAEGIADYNVLAVCGSNIQLRHSDMSNINKAVDEAYDVEDDNDSSSDYEDEDEDEDENEEQDYNLQDNDDAASEISDSENDDDYSESSSDEEYDRFNMVQHVKTLSKQLSALSAIVVKWVTPNDAKKFLKYDDVKILSKQVTYLADLVTKFVKSRGSSDSKDILKFDDLAGCR
jgi:hypothetical protein